MSKKFIKKILALSLIVLLIVAIAGCGNDNAKKDGNNPSTKDGKITIRVGHVLAPDHTYNLALNHFAELVSKKTNGKVEVKVFPSSQLGNERDLVEGMQVHTVEMGLISTGPISGFVPEIMLLDLPYLFRDQAHAYKVLDGEVGDMINKKMLDAGIRNLAWWDQGFRSVFNTKRPINKPEDMSGIKIRVMENPLMIDTFNIMGASSTPMAWGEVYTALQQKTIDAAEGAMETAYTGGFAEVTKYLSMTKHFYSGVPLLIDEKFFQGLPEDIKKALQEAAVEGRDYERKLLQSREQEMLAKIKEKGVEVNTPDLEPFRKAVQPLYDKYAQKVGGKDLIQKVIDTK